MSLLLAVALLAGLSIQALSKALQATPTAARPDIVRIDGRWTGERAEMPAGPSFLHPHTAALGAALCPTLPPPKTARLVSHT